MRPKWADFLFTLAVRFICGAVMGAAASFLVCVPPRHGGRNSLLLWVVGDENHPHRFAYWVGICSLLGGIIGMLTTPRWQTPWYKYERLQFDEEDKKDDVT